jgi:hypothetical protein
MDFWHECFGHKTIGGHRKNMPNPRVHAYFSPVRSKGIIAYILVYGHYYLPLFIVADLSLAVFRSTCQAFVNCDDARKRISRIENTE